MSFWGRLVGNTMEIHDTVDGQQRQYKRSTDIHGRTYESYAVDGRPAPIDASVRRWIHDAQVVPRRRCRRHPHCLRPLYRDLPPISAATSAVSNDPRLIKAIGLPVSVLGTRGPSYPRRQPGRPDNRPLGPEGAARLHAVGKRKGDAWQFQQLEVRPETGTGFDLRRTSVTSLFFAQAYQSIREIQCACPLPFCP